MVVVVIRLTTITTSYVSQLLHPVQIPSSQDYSLPGEVSGSGKVKDRSTEKVISRGAEKWQLKMKRVIEI